MSFCQARKASIQSSKVAIFFMNLPKPLSYRLYAARNRLGGPRRRRSRTAPRRSPISSTARPATSSRSWRRTPARHAELAADPRYAALPRDAGERSRGDLEDFAAHCEDAACRRELSTTRSPRPILRQRFARRSSAFPKEEAHFFQFKERRAKERAVEWLREQGIAKLSGSARASARASPNRSGTWKSGRIRAASVTRPSTRPRVAAIDPVEVRPPAGAGSGRLKASRAECVSAADQ